MSEIKTVITLKHLASGSVAANSVSRQSNEESFSMDSLAFTAAGVALTPANVITPRDYFIRNLSGDGMLVSLDNDGTYPVAVPVGESTIITLDIAGNLEVSTIDAEADVEADTAGEYFDLVDRSTYAARVWLNTTATTEVSTITAVADASDSLDGTYFLIYDAAGSVGVWIDIDDSGTTIPAGAGAADRAIEITSIATDATAGTVAAAIQAALDADGAFSAAALSTIVTVTDAAAGARTDVAAGDSGFAVAVTTQGHTAPAAPATPASGRLLPVVTTVNATAIENAVAIAAAIDADAEFTAAVPTTSLVTISDRHPGTRVNIDAGDTGWTVATTQQGAALPIVFAKSKGTSQGQIMVIPG